MNIETKLNFTGLLNGYGRCSALVEVNMDGIGMAEYEVELDDGRTSDRISSRQPSSTVAKLVDNNANTLAAIKRCAAEAVYGKSKATTHVPEDVNNSLRSMGLSMQFKHQLGGGVWALKMGDVVINEFRNMDLLVNYVVRHMADGRH